MSKQKNINDIVEEYYPIETIVYQIKIKNRNLSKMVTKEIYRRGFGEFRF